MEKIFVIDDDILVLRAINKLLSIKGYSVKEARSGQEAIQILKNEIFDLIISDIRMAGIDGIQVVEQLRNMGRNTPVILVTGYASEEAPIEAYRLGVNDYILKPFDKDDLLNKVEKNLINRKEKIIDLSKLLAELESAVEQFQNKNDSLIFENEKLKFFFKKLDAIIFSLKKYQAKVNA